MSEDRTAILELVVRELSKIIEQQSTEINYLKKSRDNMVRLASMRYKEYMDHLEKHGDGG